MMNQHDDSVAAGEKNPAVYAGLIAAGAIALLILIRLTLEHK